MNEYENVFERAFAFVCAGKRGALINGTLSAPAPANPNFINAA